MKKLAAIIFSAILFCSALSAKEELFSFSAGISSGFPIYGNNSIVSTGNEISNKNQVIVGTTATINLNLIKQVTFFLGNDILWDLTWNSTEHSNKMHVSFPLGIKFYPGLGGLNLGLAYTLGFRYDFIKTELIDEHNQGTAWGNGIKVLIEYNFAHEGKSQYLPSVGGYWNLMPRGNYSYDNIIAFYIAANF